ncbi:MAG: hypothetical protein ACI9ON_000209 [Limisphaerales bacterium]|jgi:hypothetical protein
MENTQSKQLLIIYTGVGYAILRIVYEAVFNLAQSNSIYYLVGLTVGLLALKSWRDKAHDLQSELVSTLQTTALAIMIIALAMDAGRFVMLRM